MEVLSAVQHTCHQSASVSRCRACLQIVMDFACAGDVFNDFIQCYRAGLIGPDHPLLEWFYPFFHALFKTHLKTGALEAFNKTQQARYFGVTQRTNAEQQRNRSHERFQA
jgi:hypothetical protein